MTMLPRFAAAALALAATGCVPAKFSGFMPSGPGSLEAGYCAAGIRDTLHIHAPQAVGIFIRASGETSGDSSTDGPPAPMRLTVWLTIPGDVTAQLLSPDVSVQSPEWSEPRLLITRQITAPGPRHYEASAVLPGSSQESMGTFSLWFQPEVTPGARRFTVLLPPLTIGGQRFQPDAIAFEAYERWGRYTCVQ